MDGEDDPLFLSLAAGTDFRCDTSGRCLASRRLATGNACGVTIGDDLMRLLPASSRQNLTLMLYSIFSSLLLFKAAEEAIGSQMCRLSSSKSPSLLLLPSKGPMTLARDVDDAGGD